MLCCSKLVLLGVKGSVNSDALAHPATLPGGVLCALFLLSTQNVGNPQGDPPPGSSAGGARRAGSQVCRRRAAARIGRQQGAISVLSACLREPMQ